jgi:hypothetical protein
VTANRIVSTIAVTSSVTRLNRMIRGRSPRTSCGTLAFVSVSARKRARSPIRRNTTTVKNVASVMMPRPPIWISSRMTVSPKPDQ